MNKTGIKIGIDTRELRTGLRTGIGRYLLNFLREAPTYRPKWEFVLLGNQHTTATPEADNCRNIMMQEGSTIFWDQVKLPSLLKKEKIDLFFSPYNKAPLASPCKTVITIHDVAPFLPFFPQERNNPMRCISKKWFSGMAAKKADLIITPSDNSKRDIINLFRVPGEKIKVAYNGVADFFNPVKDAVLLETVKKKYAIAGDYILYVGNLKPHKNVEGLLKAYSILPEGLKDKYQLVIVGGKDKNYKTLVNMCNKLKISNNVIFIDFIDDDNLPSLYSLATIFVFPSFYEGFGLPVIEAMACGVAVITSRVSSLPEVAADAARLIDPPQPEDLTSAMRELLTNYSLRQDFVNKGLARARNFTPGKTAKSIIAAFEGIL